MASIAEIFEANPQGWIQIQPASESREHGADFTEPFVAVWFDGEHEASSVIAEGPDPLLATASLMLAMVESVIV